MERYLKAINHKLFQVLFVTFSRRHLAHSVRSSLLRPSVYLRTRPAHSTKTRTANTAKRFGFSYIKKSNPLVQSLFISDLRELRRHARPRRAFCCLRCDHMQRYSFIMIIFFVTFIFLEITRSLLHRLSLIKKSRICFVRRKKCLLASHVFSQICFTFCIWPIFLYFRRPALRPIAYGLGNWYCRVLSLFISRFLPVKYFWDIFFYNRWPGNTPRYRGQSPWPYPILRSPRENTGWKLS